MKIERRIERRITITAAEVYHALVKAHDLPPCDRVAFESAGDRFEDIELVAVSQEEQEI